MYGTRDAAHNWEREYKQFLVGLGFTAGRASPCYFRHHARDIATVVHGDDFTTLGEEHQLKWLQKQMQAKYDIKTEFLGPGHSARFEY